MLRCDHLWHSHTDVLDWSGRVCDDSVWVLRLKLLATRGMSESGRRGDRRRGRIHERLDERADGGAAVLVGAGQRERGLRRVLDGRRVAHDLVRLRLRLLGGGRALAQTAQSVGPPLVLAALTLIEPLRPPLVVVTALQRLELRVQPFVLIVALH